MRSTISSSESNRCG